MRPIPKKLRAEMSSDPFYKKCCVSGATNEKIDWHHVIIYAGKQLNQKWAILPLARSVHDDIVRHNECCLWIALNRATTLELVAISKAIDYVFMREALNQKYGKYIPRT